MSSVAPAALLRKTLATDPCRETVVFVNVHSSDVPASAVPDKNAEPKRSAMKGARPANAATLNVTHTPTLTKTTIGRWHDGDAPDGVLAGLERVDPVFSEDGTVLIDDEMQRSDIHLADSAETTGNDGIDHASVLEALLGQADALGYFNFTGSKPIELIVAAAKYWEQLMTLDAERQNAIDALPEFKNDGLPCSTADEESVTEFKINLYRKPLEAGMLELRQGFIAGLSAMAESWIKTRVVQREDADIPEDASNAADTDATETYVFGPVSAYLDSIKSAKDFGKAEVKAIIEFADSVTDALKVLASLVSDAAKTALAQELEQIRLCSHSLSSKGGQTVLALSDYRVDDYQARLDHLESEIVAALKTSCFSESAFVQTHEIDAQQEFIKEQFLTLKSLEYGILIHKSVGEIEAANADALSQQCHLLKWVLQLLLDVLNMYAVVLDYINADLRASAESRYDTIYAESVAPQTTAEAEEPQATAYENSENASDDADFDQISMQKKSTPKARYVHLWQRAEGGSLDELSAHFNAFFSSEGIKGSRINDEIFAYLEATLSSLRNRYHFVSSRQESIQFLDSSVLNEGERLNFQALCDTVYPGLNKSANDLLVFLKEKMDQSRAIRAELKDKIAEENKLACSEEFQRLLKISV